MAKELTRFVLTHADGALSKHELHYLRDVRRLRDGATVDVRNGCGHRWLAILSGDRLELGEPELLARPAGAAVQLAFAPPKGKRLDWLLEKATELGADGLHPVLCARSVRLADDENMERWQRVLNSAARQCGASFSPELSTPKPLAEFLRDSAGYELRIVADPDALRSLRDALPNVAPRSARALTGPEGGFTEEEHERLERAGFVSVNLGSLVLRAETAPLALLTILRHRYSDLG